MNYFKVFLNKGNPEVHGQILYNVYMTMYSFSSTIIWRKLEVYRLHRPYLDFEHLEVGKTLRLQVSIQKAQLN